MFREYVGVIHLHTTASDGWGDFEKVVRCAQRAKLDFLIITDHDVLTHRDREGWYDNLLVLVGEEISPPRAHYLALNIKEPIPPSSDPQVYIEEVNKQGGFGFVVHPYHKEAKFPFLPPHPWEDFPRYQGFQGIEIWSFMYDWVKKANYLNLPYFMLFPLRQLTGPPPRLLREWDALTQRRKVVGIGGLDTHGNSLFPIPVLSYLFTFRALRVHIWSDKWEGKFDRDAKKVYRALREGHSFVALDLLGDSRGFGFFTSRGEIPGCEVKLNNSLRFQIRSPLNARFHLLRNGKILRRIWGKHATLKVEEEGVYRVEGYIRGKPWLFTNPIWVRR